MLEELQQYGLSDKEANIYIISLKTGQATANRIAELSHLPRSTTYDILDRLKNMGLLTTCIIDNRINFIANDPQVLLTSLDEKNQLIQQILPSLKEIYKQIEDRPSAEVFYGKLAIIRILEEILEEASTLKIIGSQGNALERIGYHPDKFRMKRLEKKINVQQILEVSTESKKIPRDICTEIRFLPSLNASKEAIFISKDTVYHIILSHEICAIKIISKEHRAAMGVLFTELWEKAV